MRGLTKHKVRYALTFAGIVFCLALAAPPRAAAGENGGAATVRSFYDTLLATMRNGPALGPRGRYGQLAPVIRRVFDIPLMTRLALGSAWAGLSEPQRQQASQAFGRYVAAIYAERFQSYSGQQLKVTGERSMPQGTIITSQIIKANGQPVNINYLVRNNGGGWQIVDVYLDGTISELATRRSEFASILRTGGVEGLIHALDRKAETLVRMS